MNSLLREYIRLDKVANTHKDYSYEYLVNFSQTKDLPIHRWFYFVEGYSPKLVINVLKYLNTTSKDSFVFDPFAGSGTTLLTAKELGMKATGIEINPFSAFMIKVKTSNYSKDEIDQLLDFKLPKYIPQKNVYGKYELKIIKNLFDQDKLEKIELLKTKINKVENTKVRDLLYMALLTILPVVSNYRKGGNGLKRKRVNNHADTFDEFTNKVNEIANDLKMAKKGPEPMVINDTCLNLDNYDLPDIDISIFSPPYANCFDPFEVYKTELWVGEFVKSYNELGLMRKRALTSNLNANLKKEFNGFHRTELLSEIVDFLNAQTLWDKRLPKMIDTYFYDMHALLEKLYRKTKKGGYCVIVVGNSAYGNVAIPTDILLGQVGEKAGFKIQEIVEARRNETSSQQHAKLGGYLDFLRESLVILKK